MAVTWNANYELTPLPQDSPTGIDDEVRALKDSISVRMSNEHETFETDNSSGAEGDDFVHKAGSAKVYYQAAEPTLRPDGVTALDAEDAGRKWTDSDDDKSYTWSGAEWVEDYIPRIDADSTVFAGKEIFTRVYSVTIPSSTEEYSFAHGLGDISGLYTILNIASVAKVGGAGQGGYVDVDVVYTRVLAWAYNGTNITLYKISSVASRQYNVTVSYVKT